MTRQPGVVIVARHGLRLDAADQSWHLSTPTPYDPPLTYAGWNQCRALGIRIASLLHAREHSGNDSHGNPEGTEMLGPNATDTRKNDGVGSEQASHKRRTRKHKVVIHSSPFLRCLQTSIAIAAGMAQYQPPSDAASVRSRTPAQMHSASPRVRPAEGGGAHNLAPIAEPKHDLTHAIARKVILQERKRHRTAKLRIDAFLGEWLNPSYFDQITPPPPSSTMLVMAKTELMENDTVEIFTPTSSNNSSKSVLWGGGPKSASRESALDDWSDVHETLGIPTSRSEHSDSHSNTGSEGSGSGRRSPSRHGGGLFASTVPKPEYSVYVPPSPHYAVSGVIPRGYVSHAKQACVDVDYQWDSTRAAQAWGDGGEYGEEWSAMQKRFRKGLSHLVEWYSKHGTNERGEDSLGVEQVERHEDEEQEELVVILVTHGAGCNALIGALTGQPVLLDVGMASLTMAVRREDAVTQLLTQPLTNGRNRRTSLDAGLSSLYDVKIVASSEHLRPGMDPARASSTTHFSPEPNIRDGLFHRPQSFGRSTSDGAGFLDPDSASSRSSTNSALGTIRRPSGVNLAPPPTSVPGRGFLTKSNTMPVGADLDLPETKFTGGLWTPPSMTTPDLPAQERSYQEHGGFFSKLDDVVDGRRSPGYDMVLDFSTSPPESRPVSSGGAAAAGGAAIARAEELANGRPVPQRTTPLALDGALDSSLDERNGDALPELSASGDVPHNGLSRELPQRIQWGNTTLGGKDRRSAPKEPKRRWTEYKDHGAAQ